MTDSDLPAFPPAGLFDLTGWQHRELFAGCANAWDALPRLPEYLRSVLRPGIRGQVEAGAFIADDVEVAEGARVEAGACIRGPALIGPGTEVRHGAYLRGLVLTGADCVIGHASECKTAVFLDRAKAPHFGPRSRREPGGRRPAGEAAWCCALGEHPTKPLCWSPSGRCRTGPSRLRAAGPGPCGSFRELPRSALTGARRTRTDA